MSRLRIAAVVVVVVAVATGLIIAGPSSDAAGRNRRSTPGLIQSFAAKDLQFTAFNPTKRARTVTISLVDATGFTLATPQTFTVTPGQLSTRTFTCTGALGCASLPVATGDKRIVWSLQYYPMSMGMTPDQQTIVPTGWRSM